MTEAGKGARRQRGSIRLLPGVEQLSLFGWQIRAESEPAMAANWLKGRPIGQGNI